MNATVARSAADASASAARLVERCGGAVPAVAVLLGSGWSVVADRLQPRAHIDYAELPGFPSPGVRGHAGRVLVGTWAGADVLLLNGRKHEYEDGDAAAMKGAIRALAAAGVRVLMLTNAAGSLVPAIGRGSLMLIEDHLNLAQRTPLHGEPGDDRFVDLAEAYDPALIALALEAADAAGVTLHRGVYAWMLGPQFETPAEIRMLQMLGAHAVGMSTVPETIVARHAGLAVLAVSMITNLGCGLTDESLSHAHTLAGAQDAALDAERWLEALLPRLQAVL
jgi:purine-nucleoside phosphorylase